jgi:hypothetical protein
MARTVISVSLEADEAKAIGAQAKKAGKSRSQFLRDLAVGQVRLSRFKELQLKVAAQWSPQWPQTEEEIVALCRETRRERWNEKQAGR